nr:MAG TPA: hypothetical protein [Caudoviricetes sp.]
MYLTAISDVAAPLPPHSRQPCTASVLYHDTNEI